MIRREDDPRDDPAPYTSRERCRDITISLTGLAVEFGWAVGESIMLPHMLAPPLSVAPAVAGLIFAINPVLSFGASPLVGAYVDGEPALARAIVAGHLFNDVTFYWAHRASHTRLLYSKVHKQHHTYSAPVAHAAESAGPVETVLARASSACGRG